MENWLKLTNQKIKSHYWIKPFITLALLGLLTWFAPIAPIDPWNLLGPRKIATMILALALIQAFAAALARYLGVRTGALLTGFFGGLISSTATIASLAKRSKNPDNTKSSGEMLIFLSATLAMLFEGITLVVTGVSEVHFSNLLVFFGPIVTALGMIFYQLRKTKNKSATTENTPFQIVPMLKLSVFILGILSVSKIFQKLFGQNGLLIITSLVSLFEIHGSIIANVQLHELKSISIPFLSSLLTISVAASFFSKLFLIWTLGSLRLRNQVIRSTLFLLLSLVVSWIFSMILIEPKALLHHFT
jgi:uncharacterized membrane protein (DUF4010 family)